MTSDGGESCRTAMRAIRKLWPTGTDLVVIEVHDDGEPGHRDLIAYPMSSSGDQIAGDYQVLGSYCEVPEAVEVVDNVRTAVEFVARCWMEVGITTALPVFVAGHDNWESFDVRAGRWVADSDLYAR